VTSYPEPAMSHRDSHARPQTAAVQRNHRFKRVLRMPVAARTTHALIQPTSTVRLVFLLLAVMVFVVGCAIRADPPSAGAPASSASSKRTNGSGGSSVDYLTYFETPSDILRQSDEVVIGTVEGERRGSTYGPPDGRVQNRILRVSVERVLKGSPSDSVDLGTWGWSKYNGKERPFSPADEVRLEVGDRALLALAVGKDGGRGVMNQQAVFLLAEGQVVDTDRNDPVVKQLESLSEPQLIDVVQGRR